MFGFDIETLLICVVIAVLVLQPADWLKTLHLLGKWIAIFRRYILDWQDHLMTQSAKNDRSDDVGEAIQGNHHVAFKNVQQPFQVATHYVRPVILSAPPL